MGELAHDYLPGLKQWFSTKEIKKTATTVGMISYYIKILLCRKNIMTPVRSHFFPVISFFIFSRECNNIDLSGGCFNK